MKAAYIEQTGDPENIKYGDRPDPSIQEHDVLIEVAAVAVNPIDTYIRAGNIAMNLPLPYTPGCDFAGTVKEVGDQVTKYHVGDRVWGSNQGLFGKQGSFAELISVHEDWMYPIPEETSFEQAAAGALVSITAALGLTTHSHLADGETLFVNGGSGGVGSIVVQMAKAMGAQVITTAGSDEKADYCRSIGADLVLNYQDPEMDKQLQSHLEQNGKINFWWETLRSPDIARTIPFMEKRGRIIVMAGREAELLFPLGPFYVNDLKLIGFAMFNASATEQQEVACTINDFYKAGQLTIPIGKKLSLKDAALAHQLQEKKTLEGEADFHGKIILTP